MTLKRKIISITTLALLCLMINTLSFAGDGLFGGSTGSISTEDTEKQIVKKAYSILAKAGEIDGINTLGIVDGASSEDIVIKMYMAAKKENETGGSPNQSTVNEYIKSINAEMVSEFKLMNKGLLEKPETKFIENAVKSYNNDLSKAGEVVKTKLQLDKESTEVLGLSNVPTDIMDKLFEEVYDPNAAIENMTEGQKRYLEQTGDYYAFQLKATDLAKDISKVVGSDTKEWAKLIEMANDPKALEAKYGKEFEFTNDVESNIKGIVKSIEGSRDTIYDQILKVSEFNQSVLSAAEYKAVVKQYGIDEFVLNTLGGDPSIKDLMRNNPEYIKLLKMYEEYQNKYGIQYKTDITSSNTINFGQGGSNGDGQLEIVDSLKQKNFHAIGKVVFTITKKGGGSIGALSLLEDSRLQNLGKEYSGVGNQYFTATGRYIPVFKEVGRTNSSVTYEINYTDGADYDDLRDILAPVYQKYDPVIGMKVAKAGVYKIEVEVFADTLTELMSVHDEHDYSWETGIAPNKVDHSDTCKEIKYWPYKQRIVDKGSDGEHKAQLYRFNKTPDSTKKNTWIGTVEWEVNAGVGDVEIPLMGQVVSKTSFITD